MAVTLSPGSVIPLGFTAPRSGQTATTFGGYQGAGAIPVLYTAPADKKFYCLGFIIMSGTTQTVDLYNDGVRILGAPNAVLGIYQSSGSLFCVVEPTKSLTLDWSSRGGGGTCGWSFWGWEQ